ncbi:MULTISPECIES: ribonuclease T2 [unclassified Pseudomonas]|uniref:ribonuclease T2 family protein n=1 Tax=unclassified Pseudomonas TaxID=196821 RepID=UPI000BD80774|nr:MULTISPECIES: ribonuclease T2 [unclassified Pseudomonas]PVZ11503.1 ribonuclease T2 [Pseudomonas sp. URIL14HWK12:I12]PVZ22501.1 ribonuclease T2 [Pseudomonas sp. URIL14HWK12:I10]PVZ31375.1 ribonuclease T2 [Pseudomonas sp. URIL14HWK12:I11]SNZ16061.1 ribonuclease T2 [Pseudomonas sp. URIL14HWK12:I9]
MASPLRKLLMLAVLASHPFTLAHAEGTPGVFDFYVLSLSWSPSYCLSKPQDVQCRGKGYGFVLHGLWPQYANNGWPQFCEPFMPLSEAERVKGMTLFPSPALMAHEWKKHGTCSGLGAQGYLAASDQALAAVAIPAQFEPSANAQRLGAGQIKALFRQRNPAIPEDGLAVYCTRGQLSEVRVCLSKSLQPTACGAALKGQCKRDDLLIPGVR